MFILPKRIFISALKHTNPGDFNLLNLVEVEELIAGKAGLRSEKNY